MIKTFRYGRISIYQRPVQIEYYKLYLFHLLSEPEKPNNGRSVNSGKTGKKAGLKPAFSNVTPDLFVSVPEL
jgi:hypothetical protein